MINTNHKKRYDDGAVLVLTMILLLVISTLTLTFFYLQILEVDLIAYETDYIQAFYLANAALEQGIHWLNDNPNNIAAEETRLYLDPDIQAGLNLRDEDYDLDYSYDIENQDETVTVLATARVNNTQRKIQKTILLGSPPLGSQSGDFDKEIYETIEDFKTLLGDPTLISRYDPSGEVALNLVDIEANPDGLKFLSYEDKYTSAAGAKPMTDEQYAAIYNDPDNFSSLSKGWIDTVSHVSTDDDNDNELLFYKDDISYGSWTKAIDWLGYNAADYDAYDEFYFSEKRDPKTGAGIPIHPILTIKEGKTLVLEPGTYYFEELYLEKNSTLTTKGEVILLATKCIIREGAKMMGGDPDDSNNTVPENLIIIIETTVGSTLTPQIEIMGSAKVYGHILAPNGKTKIYTGINSKTLVHGSIFTREFSSEYSQNSYSYTYQIGYEGWPSMGGMQTVPGSWWEVRDS